LGRTAIQKIIYFLQVAGVPMRYSFDIYHYGPYCGRVSNDVESLVVDGIIKDDSTSPEKYSNYVPDSSLVDLLNLHPDLKSYMPVIESVVKSLLPLSPNRLELIATLDFLYRQIKAGGGNGPWKTRVIDKFIQVKKEKFPKEDIVQAYDSLVAAKLFGE
jgi:uncharacterized protein YwgA